MIAVVADSAANLPPEVAEAHGISIVPMVVHVGAQTFRDGIDLSPGELYARLAAGEGPATTATPSPADFLAAYRAAGAEEIVCVTVASSMSSAHQQAVSAASDFEGSVEVVDSLSASMAEGFVALEAARAAARGASLWEVAAAASAAAPQTRLFATVDTFDHLQRSGRVSRLQAYAATALDIKPVFAFRDGEPLAVAAETVAAAAGRRVRLAAIHAAAEDDARRVAERVRAEVEVAELFVVEVTPVVGVHVGPGLVGTAFQPVRD
jgi:DegV family protein with EDD domain